MNKKHKPRLQIIRGLPGSGKTTLALSRYSNLMRIETDMYFSREGEYRFTLPLNRKACVWFLKAVENFCIQGFDFVTTGVFAAHTERLSSVIETALQYGYEVYIKTLTDSHGSIHGVPKEHLDAMKASFVLEQELKRTYRDEKKVHFGLMPKKYPLAHLNRHNKGKQN